jgi:hypothetical protein
VFRLCTNSLTFGPPLSGRVGLLELFLAVVIVGLSVVNAAIPLTVYVRARDGRFLLLAFANLAFAGLGGLWVWGQWPGSPPSYAVVQWPVLALALLVVLLLLGTSVWPRRT